MAGDGEIWPCDCTARAEHKTRQNSTRAGHAAATLQKLTRRQARTHASVQARRHAGTQARARTSARASTSFRKCARLARTRHGACTHQHIVSANALAHRTSATVRL
eukprot:11185576-Lingulodinium_polyedra.AAC.3